MGDSPTGNQYTNGEMEALAAELHQGGTMTLTTTQLTEVDNDQARETYRRILVDALTAKAEKYRSEARFLAEVANRKNSTVLREQVGEKNKLAETADRLAVEIREA